MIKVHHLVYVNDLLSNSDYLIGSKFSAVGLQITFNRQASEALSHFANLNDFVIRMVSGLAYRRAIERGGKFNLHFSE